MTLPPAGSKITVLPQSSGGTLITLPYSSSFMRYPVAAFLIFWLCGWAGGEVGVLSRLLFHRDKLGPAAAFMVFWLGGWTIGGGFVIAMLYRMLSPSIPETLVVTPYEMTYDTGRQPPDFMAFRYYRARRENAWKKMFRKRRVITFSQTERATLKLRDIESDNRLTIDKGNERFELGTGLTEVEREWLFSTLQQIAR